MPVLEVPTFDYAGALASMLREIVNPFRLKGIDIYFERDVMYHEIRTEVTIKNVPSYNYTVKKDPLYYMDMAPEAVCESLAKSFQYNVENIRALSDIPDTIELGEN